MSQKRAVLICIFIYILCFGLAIPPLVGFGEIEFNSRFASCAPRFTPTFNLLYAVLIAVEVCIPIGILTVTSLWSIKLIRKVLKKNYRRRSIYKKKDPDGAGQNSENLKHQKQQIQLAKVFGALFIAYVVSYTPVIVVTFAALALEFTGNTIPPAELYTFAFICFLTNPVIHPIVESFFVRDLRYQVNKAKKGIRRASTIIYRQTTQLMNNKALDEANKRMDDEEKARAAAAKNGVSKHRNGNPVESMVTEMESVPGSRSNTPQSDTQESSFTEIPRATAPEEKPAEKRKVRQSVTFQEITLTEVQENGKEPVTPTSRTPKSPKSPFRSKLDNKAALFSMSNRKIAIQEEQNKVSKTIRGSAASAPSLPTTYV